VVHTKENVQQKYENIKYVPSLLYIHTLQGNTQFTVY